MESFELTMIKFNSGQEMLCKINQRGIIQKRKMVEYGSCALLRIISRNMHTKFGVIWTYMYDDKVKLQTRTSERRHRCCRLK